MPSNTIQDFLSQIRIPFLGDNLMRKYENEKSPLRAELFSTEQLEHYAISLAATHTLSTERDPEQLLKRLNENEVILLEVRNLLIESAPENSPISPAGEWLLDNFYMIEEQIRLGKRHFPKSYSETLPRLAKGPLAGHPRVYTLAVEIIAHSDGRVDPENLFSFIKAYQKDANLTLGELWAIPIMLRLAIIENLRRLAGSIARDRINKNLADYWADRMTEIAEKDPKNLIIVTADMARSDPPMASSFVAELTRRFLGKGPALTLPLTWIDQRLSENGLSTHALVHQEGQKQAADQVSMSNSIGSLRFINTTDWREFVEKSSGVEQILREDPAGVYALMDFRSRDQYRHVIERLGKRSQKSELAIANQVIALARKKSNSEHGNVLHAHVGYYLIGKGLSQTERIIGIPKTRMDRIFEKICALPFTMYSGSVLLLTLLLSAPIILHIYREGHTTLGVIVAGIISFIAISHLSTAVINWIATLIVKPDFLPRMDYSKGIPEASRTLVAVPTLYNSIDELEDLLETMEVRYLANKQEHLHFALLTDFRDASTETLPEDKALLEYAKNKIAEINKKYRGDKNDLFFLLHRPRLWNPSEHVWMGYERKRGKLGDLNAVLRGHGTEKFILIAGDVQVLHQIKYVISLDADTILPREAAWKIVATHAHPLQHPSYDEKKKRVTEGYGILQPRVANSLPQSSSSWYARIYGNEQGIDPYTRAISDVYQDVLKEGSFIGKGIYEVDAFEKSLNGKFPDNQILSHDLLEGCHAKSGLVSDVELYEEYPSSYLSDMKRRHRWIRGDWQIASWIVPRVPGREKRNIKNPLSALSRWKIFDNLRRSLVTPAFFFLLLFGWLFSPTPWFWTFTVIGLIIPTSVLSFLWSLIRKQSEITLANQLKVSFESLVNHLIQHVWTVISLPYEAYRNADAILRTIWRMLISKKHLLQWDPFVIDDKANNLTAHFKKMWIGPLFSICLLGLLPFISLSSFIIASPLLILWILSPCLAWWISLPQFRKQASLSASQTSFLKNLARKTWAYFEQFIGPDDNYLPPDNYQEVPVPKIAHRTSPTNIGLSLLSSLGAFDFGYLTMQDLIDRCRQTITTLMKLERYKGHLYNWYDTQTLLPLYPRYVSTVDSGNLSACLLTLKEGLLSLSAEPVIRPQLYDGLLDTLDVLGEKMPDDVLIKQIKDEIESVRQQQSDSFSNLYSFFKTIIATSGQLVEKTNNDPESEAFWWATAFAGQCSAVFAEYQILCPWYFREVIPSGFTSIQKWFKSNPSLKEIAINTDTLLYKLDAMYAEPLTADEQEWTRGFRSRLVDAKAKSQEMLFVIDSLAKQCIELSDYEYDFLYDKTQHLLSIGYNVEDHRRDPGFYDLLGSEARLGIYVAIAQGKIPQESWFALGRQLTKAGTDPVLISWSGSMFEYLMPQLLVPTYESTLLDQTNKGAVRRQIEYGKRRGLPWGNSESCFNMVHSNMDYQYRAFGVPGLGIKRGLSEDFVVAPYASVMALMVLPEESYDNIKTLSDHGYEGKWGLYEAVDFTPSRLQRGQTAGIVKAFMTHHQGMSFLSLAHLLLDQPMQKRFEANLQFQTSLLLLQEKIPQVTTYFSPATDLAELPAEMTNSELRVMHTAKTPVPEVQLLSNGRYHVMISNAGGGYSRWNDLAVTRWREDGIRDNWGNFCFIRDLESQEFWSSTHHPSLKLAEHFEVIFSQGRAEFRRKDFAIEAHTEIVVSPEDDVEMRRLHLTNRSRKRRQIEITSYGEVVLNSAIAEMLHPAFSNLFVQTEILPARNAVICTRRPRSVEEHPAWMFHLMKAHGAVVREVTYETSREHFIGRGNSIEHPHAMRQKQGLSGHEGSVLDPIVAIQYRLVLEPFESATIDMVYGITQSREGCQGLLEKYQDKHMIDRAFELAWTHSQVVLRQINASSADSLLYCRLAGSIIYSNASFRTDPGTIIKNHRGQSGLWSHSISGDWPIVLLQIEDGANIELVENLVRAHSFWRLKGLIVDLVIWNEDHGGYRQVLQNQILSLITPASTAEEQEKPGGIYLRTAEQLSNEDRILFQTVARVIISDKLGTLEGQLNRRKQLKSILPNFIPSKFYSSIESAFEYPEDLQFFNGLGGHSKDGKEYITITKPDAITPAPWSNVIANPQFGTVISESGQSYTWFQNAHELRLTPWHNDPVSDLGGEHFYIRDEETGRYWSPAPLPARGKTPYVTRHGFGYSVFEHTEDGIQSEMWVYVDIEKPIKYTVLKLRNRSGKARQLTVTGYVEWVLGDLRHKTMMHITTEPDLQTGAIVAHNAYSTEFGRMSAFFDVNEQTRFITTDREEFIGRNGTSKNPDALSKAKLSGRTGAALDPCGVIQVVLNLEDVEEMEVIFRLGTGSGMHDLNHLMRQSRGKNTAKEVLQKVRNYWETTLSVIQIESPDPALNTLTNGWLSYQTLSCRMWARSGYYQSGGAYGYRDQLQDVLSLLHTRPAMAREQIKLCASRQFIQGDVQHWWHPPVGRGVRTRCSDDYLWLPYVTSCYVLVTGDDSILDESIPFLESRELGKDEDSYYDMPIRSDQTGTLYEHCVRALKYGFQFGTHGLPLMGTGDWNDGMDRVGADGKGESVWLGWFLFDTIQKFKEIALHRKDTLLLDQCDAQSMILKANIETHAWDGAWYRRAYFDDGTPLGSAQNKECKIDSIAQSWSVLSKAGDTQRSLQGLMEAEKRLVRKADKIIQLFDPPFDTSELNPGYIKGYVPGVRENGGQYTHAAIWMIMAFAAVRNKTKMWELLQMINPINHGNSPEAIQVYKVEPYVIAADVYAVSQHAGRGGWTWYTGSAGWLYQLIIDSVIGIKRRGDTLRFEPCLPEAWNEVVVRYTYKSTVYAIRIRQVPPEEDIFITLDGERLESKSISLIDDGREHGVLVTVPNE